MKGNITFSAVIHSSQGRSVRIQIEDKLSHTTFLEVTMSLESFALATIGNLGNVECEFDLHAQNAGKKIEIKTEQVFLANAYFATDEARAEAVKPFEVDGWKARDRDISNSHRYTQTDNGYMVKVVFSRFAE